MKKPIMLEKQIICRNNHLNQPILGINLDQSLNIEQRLLCQICLQESQSSILNFEEVRENIQDKQNNLYDVFCIKITSIIQKLENYKISIQSFQKCLNNNLENILVNIDQWTLNLLEIEKKQGYFSLIKELEIMYQPIEEFYKDQQRMIDQCNQYYFNKMQFSFITNDIMNKFITLGQQLNDITFYQSENQIKLFEKQLYKKAFSTAQCFKHNSKILYVNISKDQSRENRLRCIHCGQGDSIPISEFEIKWRQSYKEQLLQHRTQRIKKINEFSRQQSVLNKLILEQQQGIFQLIEILNQNIFSILINQKQFIESTDHSFMTCMAEQLSQIDLNNENAEQIQNNKFKKDNFILLKGLVKLYKEKITEYCFKQIKYEMIQNSILQQEICRAIAFNYDGSLIAVTCFYDINVWKFEKGILKDKQIKLSGHSNVVCCLIWSKTQNWIASGGQDQTIRLWKKTENNIWKCSISVKEHKDSIFCLIMNKNEDQLISGGCDNSIKIWKINYQTNELIYDYQLNKHLGYIYSITLNESENTLASCSYDKQIIIWEKTINKKWTFKQKIEQSIDDFGCRICFINDNLLIWQQHGQGFTYIFELENNIFSEKNHKIELNQVGSDYSCFFPSVWNKQRQIIIQKHNQYVYIISIKQKNKTNSIFKIECEPINCLTYYNYGALSNDGQYLIIWDNTTKIFKVFLIKYD